MATTEQELPPNEVYGPDADGIKTLVEYRFAEDGGVEKVTKRIQITQDTARVKKAIADRREWKKFGLAFGYQHGVLEPGVIGIMDDRRLMTPGKETVNVKPKATIVCRTCGDAHFTYQCPHKDRLFKKDEVPKKEEAADEQRGGAYVVHKRGAGVLPPGSGKSGGHDDYSVRVSNLPEEVDEKKLKDLFSQCGNVSRFYLARNKVSNELRGFAFVNYVSKEDAENAIRRLNRSPFMHMILTVEWAKPQ